MQIDSPLQLAIIVLGVLFVAFILYKLARPLLIIFLCACIGAAVYWLHSMR